MSAVAVRSASREAPAGGLAGRSRPGSAVRLHSRGTSRERVAVMQRSRLLAGALCEIDERGYAATTVGHITRRSRISRRTFYELFTGREECLIALLDQAARTVERDLLDANLAGLSWRERVRGGLWVILSFLDREPALARVCVVQALGAGDGVLERREQLVSRLACMVDAGRGETPQADGCSRLTAEGVVGAALAIVYGRLLRRDPEPLGGLLGELMGMIVLPYLGKTAARREQIRPMPVLPTQGDRDAGEGVRSMGGDPLAGVAIRWTYRTARVLEAIGELPGSSNRAIAEVAGVHDPGQISKLLLRLRKAGLVENTNGSGARFSGEPNAWRLTVKGREIERALRAGQGSRHGRRVMTPGSNDTWEGQ